jgi:hypothetical protein
MPPVTIHIVGNGVMVGTVSRQRCAWCGFLLMDDDWAAMATGPGSSAAPHWWPDGELIEVGDNWKSVIQHPKSEPLPPACCAARPEPPPEPPALRLVTPETE